MNRLNPDANARRKRMGATRKLLTDYGNLKKDPQMSDRMGTQGYGFQEWRNDKNSFCCFRIKISQIVSPSQATYQLHNTDIIKLQTTSITKIGWIYKILNFPRYMIKLNLCTTNIILTIHVMFHSHVAKIVGKNKQTRENM